MPPPTSAPMPPPWSTPPALAVTCSTRRQGDFHGMNGFYAAGILEGVAHYLPETVDWWKGGE
jgi:hypothetical protein